MKTKLLLLLLLFTIASGYGQQDKQWLIFNGIGKEGVNPAMNLNVFPPTNIISTVFAIDGAAHPNPAIPNARNDIFVIYEDGQHFNSRDSDLPSVFTPQVGSAAQTVHNFKTGHNSPIKYFYLTNRYEGDDPPERMRVRPGSGGQNPIPYQFNVTRPNKLITTSRGVTFTKDITVIINYDSLNQLHLTDTLLTFRFDSVLKRATGVKFKADFLNPQPAFGGNSTCPSSFVYPLSGATGSGTGNVTLPANGGGFRYINLRPSSGAVQYGAGADGNARFDAVLSINRGKKLITQMLVGIDDPHDPNFLRVDSVCMMQDSSYMVFYRLQFENVSPNPANSITAKLTFPEMFDFSCMVAEEWNVADVACQGSLHFSGRECAFVFEGNQAIVKCVEPGFQNVCGGFVRFRVKVEKGSDLEDAENSLYLTSPQVLFDDLAFPVERFDDWTMWKDYLGTQSLRRNISGEYCSYCSSRFPWNNVLIGVFLGAGVIALFRIIRRRRKQRP